MKRFLGVLLVLVLVVSLATIGLPSPVQAATFTVNSIADTTDANPGNGTCDDGTGKCTLRAAIQETNALAGPDTINLPAGNYTLSIAGTGEDAAATGDLDITDNLTIIGADQTTTIIDGGSLDRVFHVLSGVVDISNVAIQSGIETFGGGVHNRSTLVLDNTTVTGNTARSQGGGIYNVATLTLTDSTVSGNNAAQGGGIYALGTTVTITNSTVRDNTTWGAGGGIYSSTILTITMSTISGNSAAGGGGIRSEYITTITNSTINGNTATTWDGGGINNVGVTISNSLTLTNCTVNNNEAFRSGGGIMSTFGAPVNLKNTIIANNAGGDYGGWAGVTSLGHNLDSDGTCALGGTGDISNTNPLLGPLQDNGGPTFTHALLTGSPAIDAGDNTACPATDQRGVTRPQDGDGDSDAICDIGAYEYVPPLIPPVEVGGEVYPMNKLAMLAPLILLAAIIIAGATLAVRHRRARS